MGAENAEDRCAVGESLQIECLDEDPDEGEKLLRQPGQQVFEPRTGEKRDIIKDSERSRAGDGQKK
jgi:hypothetical protein